MAKNTNKPLYLSVEPQLYKNSKASLLNSQIDLLNSMKHLHELKQIKEEKFKTKMRLYALFSSMTQDFEKLTVKLPDVDLPKEQKIKEVKIKQEITKTPKIQKPVTEYDLRKKSIEDELADIQGKLKRLNSA